VRKSLRNSARASTHGTVLSTGAIFGAVILLVSGVKEAQAGGEHQFPELPSQELARMAAQPQLSIADRVAYQYAIEEVYWRHQIWPSENVSPKPPLDQVMSSSQIERKVEKYLRNSKLLSGQWQQPITAEQLQGEMDRMARQTKQPEVLQEIFAALNNDPAVIAESFVRPILAERLVRNLNKGKKESFELDVARAGKETSQTGTESIVKYTLPQITGSSTCNYDGWVATTASNAPTGRSRFAAVWTGTEMIFWGGEYDLDTGGKYNPSTDSWVATSTSGAPEGRRWHTAVWTGTEMIVWGGKFFAARAFQDVNTGGRYNPSTDTWIATSTSGAPTRRAKHAAVWTGTEMIVWGGYDNTGGKYNPNTNSWVATSTTGAPAGHSFPTPVWTGSEMIVSAAGGGGRYQPNTDAWIAISTSGAPTARESQTAVWTGSEMVVWGGEFRDGINPAEELRTGGRYNPTTDTWIATSLGGAPAGRSLHTAVWTGSEMIVWGGHFYNDAGEQWMSSGGRYNPTTDSWVATTTSGALARRAEHIAVWTGSEMIVWGGYVEENGIGMELHTGGKLCGQSTPTPVTLLGNVATRLRVETGDNVLIGGFIVIGTEPKKIIVRAIGPSTGLTGTLVDPILELRDSSGALIGSNDNWRTTQEQEIIATGLSPIDDSESALVQTLPANAAYTAIVRGAGNGTGIGLVEIYDLDPIVDSKLGNISTRGLVQTGDNAMIAGTIILGEGTQRVLVRAMGPSVPVSGALSDPILELRDSNGALIRANNNWRTDQEAEIIATGIVPSNDLESALVETLPASGAAYTAIVRGVNDATGVALVEVYRLAN
jgi:hypothetical protein